MTDRTKEFRGAVEVFRPAVVGNAARNETFPEDSYSQSSVLNMDQPLSPRQAETSEFLQLAVSVAVGFEGTSKLIERLKKLVGRKGFSNNPAAEISDVMKLFEGDMAGLQRDIASLQRHADGRSRGSPPANSQRQKHCRHIVDALQNSAKEHTKAFRDALLLRAAVEKQQNDRQRIFSHSRGVAPATQLDYPLFGNSSSKTSTGLRSRAARRAAAPSPPSFSPPGQNRGANGQPSPPNFSGVSGDRRSLPSPHNPLGEQYSGGKEIGRRNGHNPRSGTQSTIAPHQQPIPPAPRPQGVDDRSTDGGASSTSAGALNSTDNDRVGFPMGMGNRLRGTDGNMGSRGVVRGGNGAGYGSGWDAGTGGGGGPLPPTEAFRGGNGAFGLRKRGREDGADAEDESRRAAWQLEVQEDSKNRVEESHKVEKMIGELGQMFSRFSTMVAAQEEVVMHIEDDVEAAHAFAEEGQANLAKYYQIMSGNRGIIAKVFIMLIVFIWIFLGVMQ